MPVISVYSLSFSCKKATKPSSRFATSASVGVQKLSADTSSDLINPTVAASEKMTPLYVSSWMRTAADICHHLSWPGSSKPKLKVAARLGLPSPFISPVATAVIPSCSELAMETAVSRPACSWLHPITARTGTMMHQPIHRAIYILQEKLIL